MQYAGHWLASIMFISPIYVSISMYKQDIKPICTVFFIAYIIFTIVAFIQGQTWFYDGLFAVALLTVLYLLSNKLKLGKLEFILANAAIIVHLLGFFGMYAYGFGVFQYDNIVHVFAGGVVAWIVFNFVNKAFDKKVFAKHKVFLLFMVIALAVALSLTVELTEFGGFLLLGEGEGILFVGSGDFDGQSVYGNYQDAMDDTVANIFGAIIGAFSYYWIRYKKA